MATSLDINDIITQVKNLDKEDQITLIQRLTLLLKATEVNESATMSLTSISGLGSEIWKNVDVENYIEGERQW